MTTFKVIREIPAEGQDYTEGTLVCSDTARSYFTLELPWKGNNPVESCIPLGTYRCIIGWSNRYSRLMPRLMDVPNRSGILIHPGNTTGDTHGCILVGEMRGANGTIINSRDAFALFFYWLGVAAKEGDVFCEVTDGGADA